MNTNRSNQMAATAGRPWMNSVAAVLLTTMLLAGASSPVQAQAPAAAAPPTAAMKDESRKLATLLIKNSLVAVNQGNLTGNYTVLRDLASPGFRQLNSASDLGVIFANLRKNKIDLSPIVLMEPVISSAKFSKEQQQLRLKGHFPSEPVQIEFELVFQQANPAGWLIHGVSIGTTKAGAQSNQDPAEAEEPTAAVQPRPAVRPVSSGTRTPATGTAPKRP